MKNIAIIGAGISALSLGQILKENKCLNIRLFEKNSYNGGLVHCTEEDDILFHRVGGHVFNSRIPEVLEWFWSIFDKEDFVLSSRKSKILFGNDCFIDYPIENYIYQLGEEAGKSIVHELLTRFKNRTEEVNNFEDFLKQRFGETLYAKYFQPYNEKIWKYDLSQIPLEWLDGKLPMPDVEGIVNANLFRQTESQMVHSSFYYPRKGGSQFIADKLSIGLSIRYNNSIETFEYKNGYWILNDEKFDKVIFTGDVRTLVDSLSDELLSIDIKQKLNLLKSNPTTNVLCELDPIALSWLYLPERNIKPHRIIYTGNFSPYNNGTCSRITGTIEYSGYISQSDFEKEIETLPGHPKIVAYNYCPLSYVFHLEETKDIIERVRYELSAKNFYLLGRFAEWEYYNMDTAIFAAMQLAKKI